MTKCDPVPTHSYDRGETSPPKNINWTCRIISIFMAQIDQLAAITIAFGILGIRRIYIVSNVLVLRGG